MAKSYIDITGIPFSKRELTEYLKMCSSIDSKGNIHPRVILSPNGKPIPAQEYQKLIGAHKLRELANFDKTPYERSRAKRMKLQHKNSMRDFYGPNWRIVSSKLSRYNVPESKEERQQLLQEMSNLNLR